MFNYKAYLQQWRKDNPILNYLQRIREINKLNNVKQEMINLFGGKCSNCGYNKFNMALEFHHKDKEEKINDISNLVRKFKKDKTKINEELEKCVLLCSNCHKEVHSKKYEQDRKEELIKLNVKECYIKELLEHTKPINKKIVLAMLN
jgi:hypothetical protein